MPFCLAFGCSNTSEKVKKKIFFTIPNPKNNRELCARLLHNMGNSKWNVNNFVASNNLRLCSDHFDAECFKHDLKFEVVPNRGRSVVHKH